jgi:simple sugar transport system permease protein
MNWSAILILTLLMQLLAASIRLGMPLVVAAIGEIFAERAGVFNLSVEGVMLFGGFCGFLAAYYTGSLWVGILAALAVGALMGAIFAFWTVSLKCNQIVAGFAILAFCTGTAMYFNFVAFPPTGMTIFPSVTPFQLVSIPFVSEIPFVGTILLKQDVLTYLFLLIVPLSAILLDKTRFGLRVKAVGEYPAAADTVGVNVVFIRFASVIIGGMMAALAGAYYSLAELGMYNDTMINGRGFIALALVIFGRWNPYWVLAGGLVFGAIDTLQYRLQSFGVSLPSQFLIMLPYVLTIFALLVGRQQAAPTNITKAYSRE